eukprot:CAMPEP_0173075510 /NCGR_PEP_ID=MMETSP1102-20130122/11711_1 /TAXON_ID=49646 /ORGANISM="Geminigera sp., Strain Caron Lab Isolate" /LENGTH=59 /DNA_ID=CAMNT_0013944895 /DNA_START=230 /DNA_END=406 /DNA_ORIENTATION=-
MVGVRHDGGTSSLPCWLTVRHPFSLETGNAHKWWGTQAILTPGHLRSAATRVKRDTARH